MHIQTETPTSPPVHSPEVVPVRRLRPRSTAVLLAGVVAAGGVALGVLVSDRGTNLPVPQPPSAQVADRGVVPVVPFAVDLGSDAGEIGHTEDG